MEALTIFQSLFLKRVGIKIKIWSAAVVIGASNVVVKPICFV